jgi:hypothetical protein
LYGNAWESDPDLVCRVDRILEKNNCEQNHNKIIHWTLPYPVWLPEIPFIFP